MPQSILRIAIPSPMHRSFDYLPPAGCNITALAPGVRVRVPFGKTKTIGILLEVAAHSPMEISRLRSALEVLDEQPLLSPDLLQLAHWANSYYHHPLGEILTSMLPALLRTGQAAEAKNLRHWVVTPQGKAVSSDALQRAPRQAAIMCLLQAHTEGVSSTQLAEQPGDWQGALRILIRKGWVGVKEQHANDGKRPPKPEPRLQEAHLTLNMSQQQAVAAVCNALGRKPECGERRDAQKQPLGTTAWMHDSKDGGGRTASGTAVEEVGQRREQLPRKPECGSLPASCLPRHSCIPAHRERRRSPGMAEGRATHGAGCRDAQEQPLESFQAFLLDGVTGSGKTEVYLQIIAQTLARGLQALLLVPEIGLTPQLIERFQSRFHVPLAVLHSGLSDRERLSAWVMARSGQAPIVIGTRSAVFAPLLHPGIIIIDEEHDTSFKQQDGFRYSARDVAVMRAHQANIPVVLGSATPSLESLHNVNMGRYRSLKLPERTGSAAHPSIETLDVRHQPMDDSLSQPLLTLIARHLANHNQVLLFLNRRGYAPTLLCHDCGWVAECRRCDTHLTLHQGSRLLQCHHCGTQRPLDKHCPSCKSADLRALGYGTERIEQALKNKFPGTLITRIDRDSTRRKGTLQTLLDSAHSGASQILLGTQMLAKGHHFPDVTLVGILDTDQGLFSADFRASERMAQLILQVAGRAGRAEKSGQVVLQTHHPDHPLLQLLLTQGYHRFAEAALQERRETNLPPYSNLVLLRAEASHRELPPLFLSEARAAAERLVMTGVNLMGPAPAPMEKRAGRYRAHLLLQATRRSDLHRLLDAWIPHLEKLPLARKVRWAVDVDPMDMF